MNIKEVGQSTILALAARIEELELEIVRLPTGVENADTTCTNCDTNCTNCKADRFTNVLVPAELEQLSGGELVQRLQVGLSPK